MDHCGISNQKSYSYHVGIYNVGGLQALNDGLLVLCSTSHVFFKAGQSRGYVLYIFIFLSTHAREASHESVMRYLMVSPTPGKPWIFLVPEVPARRISSSECANQGGQLDGLDGLVP